MNIVFERIPAEMQEKIQVGANVSGKPFAMPNWNRVPRKWVIDKKEEVFLVALGGVGPALPGRLFVLGIKGQLWKLYCNTFEEKNDQRFLYVIEIPAAYVLLNGGTTNDPLLEEIENTFVHCFRELYIADKPSSFFEPYDDVEIRVLRVGVKNK